MSATRTLLILSLSLLVCGAAVAGTPQDIIWQTTAGSAIAISPDAQLMLAGPDLRHTSDGSLIRTFRTGYTSESASANTSAVAFSPDGTLAALGIFAFNRNLFLFRVGDGVRLAGPISAHNNGTTTVAFSPNGQLLASGGRDGTVKLWHLPEMTLLQTLNGGVGYRPRVFAVVFSKDGSLIGVGGQGGIVVYQVSDGRFVGQLTKVETISFALSPDGRLLASGHNEIDQYGQCVDCTIKLWRATDGALLRTIPGNNNGVKSLAFSPDQGELAAGGGDREFSGSVRFFQVATGQLIGSWLQDPNNSASYVTSVTYAPFGRVFMYSRSDMRVTAAFDPF